MRLGATALILAAFLQPAAQAQEARVRMLGKDWVGADGNQRTAQMGLYFDWSREPSAELVRRLEVNWKTSPYQEGPFPVPVGEADRAATLSVTLNVDEAGVLRACQVTKSSGEAAFDRHVCPHLLKHLRFHPALTRAGNRAGGEVSANVDYRAGRILVSTPGVITPAPSQPRPRPLKPIDAAAIGFSAKDGLPENVFGASGMLRVEADGTVSACTLTAPTHVDRFDLAICERLRTWPFEPAADQAGKAIPAIYSFGASRAW